MNGLKGIDIDHELGHAFPKRLWPWVSVGLAPEEAAETGHDAGHLAKGERFGGRDWRLAISQIECYHRTIKQVCNIERFQVRTRKRVPRRAVSTAFLRRTTALAGRLLPSAPWPAPAQLVQRQQGR